MALKLAEGEICRRKFGGDYPVFLFDDVLSELDADRQQYLLHKTEGKQVIMTACDFPIKDSKMKDVYTVYVKNGKYMPQSGDK